jgi:hypothetical protein
VMMLAIGYARPFSAPSRGRGPRGISRFRPQSFPARSDRSSMSRTTSGFTFHTTTR